MLSARNTQSPVTSTFALPTVSMATANAPALTATLNGSATDNLFWGVSSLGNTELPDCLRSDQLSST